MPLDRIDLQTAEALNARFARAPRAALAHALSGALGRVALVSSFGAESAVLLHMVARRTPETPVLFIDTLMLFPETLDYQADLAERLGLRDLRRIAPAPETLARHDPDASLHRSNPDACCALRKTETLTRALAEFDIWITGRKRYQGGARARLPLFEVEEGRGRTRLKLNPLTDWDAARIGAYMDRHALPRHPLTARGYPSIGCAPCTSPAVPGEDPRAGRWRGRDKTECGIHFENGRVVRGAGTMNIVVTDRGFAPDSGGTDWHDLDPGADADALRAALAHPAVRIAFPGFADGRGFSLAARLRRMGFRGRLRAHGHVISDQYAMARRAGFDEVEIDRGLAERQPEAQWLARADWQAHDYRARTRRRA